MFDIKTKLDIKSIKNKSAVEITAELIRKMSLEAFIETFLYLWDPEQMQYSVFRLWPKQREVCRLLDSEKKLFWPKARQVGGSQIAAAKAIKTALEEPNAEIIVISKNDRKSRSFLKKRILPLLKTLPGKGVIPAIAGIDFGSWVPTQDKVEFSNGSTTSCVPTEDDSARGETARLIIMDEAGTMQHAGDVWKAASPAVDQNPNGQMVVISNAKAGSWFNNMVQKIRQGKMSGVGLHFMSVWTDPKRTEKWEAIRKTQFDNDIDFRVEYPKSLDDMFLRREGHVFPTFDPKEDGRHVFQFDADWSKLLIYGYDHGFDHFAVFLFMLYDQYDDKLYIFDELFASQKDTYEVSMMINQKIAYWHERGMPEGTWKRIADSSIFADRGQKTVADLLRVYTKLTFTKSLKHDEEGSTNLLRARFTMNRITIHPRCYETIRQIQNLMFGPNGKAIDRDNDSTDILRYVSAELRQDVRPVKESLPRAYNRDGNKPVTHQKEKGKNSWNSWMSC